MTHNNRGQRDYLRAVLDACPPDVFGEIVEQAVSLARDGDGQARQWLTGVIFKNQDMSIDHMAVQRPAVFDAMQDAAGRAETAEDVLIQQVRGEALARIREDFSHEITYGKTLLRLVADEQVRQAVAEFGEQALQPEHIITTADNVLKRCRELQ